MLYSDNQETIEGPLATMASPQKTANSTPPRATPVTTPKARSSTDDTAEPDSTAVRQSERLKRRRERAITPVRHMTDKDVHSPSPTHSQPSNWNDAPDDDRGAPLAKPGGFQIPPETIGKLLSALWRTRSRILREDQTSLLLPYS